VGSTYRRKVLMSAERTRRHQSPERGGTRCHPTGYGSSSKRRPGESAGTYSWQHLSRPTSSPPRAAAPRPARGVVRNEVRNEVPSGPGLWRAGGQTRKGDSKCSWFNLSYASRVDSPPSINVGKVALMRKRMKRLVLSKETLRNLDARLGLVAGGYPVSTESRCPDCTTQCDSTSCFPSCFPTACGC
jgi:hypothetical protein